MTEHNIQKHSGTTCPQLSEREIIHSRLAHRLAADGIVLLKNEGILPLDHSVPLALLGSGAGKTVKGGIGSGDVNNRESISIWQGLKKAGATLVNEKWLHEYDECYMAAREKWKTKILEEARHTENPFDAYAANPFVLPEGRRITADDIKGAKAVIYVISRISGEGKDRRKIKGDYYLSEREYDEITDISQRNIPIILIINAGGPVELTDILAEAKNIQAILNISQPGQEGGYAVADILFGRCTPSGKLTTTWAKRYEDYPCADSYSYLNGNLEKEEYNEGIYVGYRHFHRFGIQPLYPFGFGLSYTSFSLHFTGLNVNETSVQINVLVKNTGEHFAGREVVQIYAALPQTDEEKEYQRLVGFAKTDVLLPEETQELTIIIEQKQLGIFSEKKHSWLVEKGNYGLWIGNHSASLNLAAVLTVPEQVIIEQTHPLCNMPYHLQEDELHNITVLLKNKSYASPKEEPPHFVFIPKNENTTILHQRKKPVNSSLAAKFPAEELIPLLYGNITKGASTLGSSGIRVPGSAGETSEVLEETYGVRSLIMADGPAGLRLRQSYEVDRQTDTVYGVGVLGSLENGFLETADIHENADTYYQYCTAFPVGTALAQTWDKELMNEFGMAIAKEMQEFHVNLWLAPGMNIHRNPLCGRNFEYYSEDPFLSGTLAAAVTAGVQSQKGCGVTIKHFACNNQEDNRMGVNVCISEKALREIYLRGFEIAIKKSSPVAVMSSYNKINGIYSANYKDLCTTVLREEWGFDGVVMSDWNTTYPENGSIPWQCAAAGNDIIMPGSLKDNENILKAYREGLLSENAIRECAERILTLVQKLTQ